MIRLPEIGGIITAERYREACLYYGFYNLIEKMDANTDAFKPFKFDGCSCVPDRLLGIISKKGWKKVTEQCWKHDLKYAIGSLDKEETERARADLELKEDLINEAEVDPGVAELFLFLVSKYGGSEFGMSFSWGFAWKEK